MTTLTTKLPGGTTEPLTLLAGCRVLSANKLVQELSARSLVAWDSGNQLPDKAARGQGKEASAIEMLAILGQLEAGKYAPRC